MDDRIRYPFGEQTQLRQHFLLHVQVFRPLDRVERPVEIPLDDLQLRDFLQRLRDRLLRVVLLDRLLVAQQSFRLVPFPRQDQALQVQALRAVGVARQVVLDDFVGRGVVLRVQEEQCLPQQDQLLLVFYINTVV